MTDHVYGVTEVAGTSSKSMEDVITNAISPQ